MDFTRRAATPCGDREGTARGGHGAALPPQPTPDRGRAAGRGQRCGRPRAPIGAALLLRERRAAHWRSATRRRRAAGPGRARGTPAPLLQPNPTAVPPQSGGPAAPPPRPAPDYPALRTKPLTRRSISGTEGHPARRCPRPAPTGPAPPAPSPPSRSPAPGGAGSARRCYATAARAAGPLRLALCSRRGRRGSPRPAAGAGPSLARAPAAPAAPPAARPSPAVLPGPARRRRSAGSALLRPGPPPRGTRPSPALPATQRRRPRGARRSRPRPRPPRMVAARC